MGLEFTRGNSARCPPLLVGGLMIMCLFLLCSWWSLSSQNFELLRQNDNLAEQLRINGEELRKYKEQSAELEVQMKQIKDADQESQFQCQKQNELCQTEMKSLKKLGESKEIDLETLRANKISLEKDLEAEKGKVDKLTRELDMKNDRVEELEKELDEKKQSLSGLEKKIEALKGSNVHIDNKEPIVRVMEKNLNKKSVPENNGKLIKNEVIPGFRVGNNQESAAVHDENNGGEAKNEDPAADAGDPREQEMGA